MLCVSADNRQYQLPVKFLDFGNSILDSELYKFYSYVFRIVLNISRILPGRYFIKHTHPQSFSCKIIPGKNYIYVDRK